MTRYEKLVRDLIPEHLTARGIRHQTRLLADQEYAEALRAKLLEEVAEFASASSPDDRRAELVDVLEVVYALAGLDGLTPDGLEQQRVAKARHNGSFERRLFLIEAD